MPQGRRGLQGRAKGAGLPGVAPPMGGMRALSLLGCEGEWGRPGADCERNGPGSRGCSPGAAFRRKERGEGLVGPWGG